MLVLVSLCLLLLTTVKAQDDAPSGFDLIGKPCNTSNSLLLLASNQLATDCKYVAWCDPTSNTCKERGCRVDEYPFGYSTVERSKWPKLCSSNQFCPDEGSLCMDKIALGGACQLNRDDQCATSDANPEVKCLHNVCTAVNATEGATCVNENVVYTIYTPDSSYYGDIISRDNCQNGTYCDAASTKCITRLAKGAKCSSDKQCSTNYCQDADYYSSTPDNNDDAGTCVDSPYVHTTSHAAWVYPVIIIVVIVPIALIVLALLKLHVKQASERRAKSYAYWESQRAIQEKARLFRDDLLRNSMSAPLPSSPLLSQTERNKARMDDEATLSPPSNRSTYANKRLSAAQQGVRHQFTESGQGTGANTSETSLLGASDNANANVFVDSPASHRLSLQQPSPQSGGSGTDSPSNGPLSLAAGGGGAGQRRASRSGEGGAHGGNGYFEVPVEYGVPVGGSASEHAPAVQHGSRTAIPQSNSYTDTLQQAAGRASNGRRQSRQ